MLTEFRNDGHAENSIPPKTPFCGGGGGGYNYPQKKKRRKKMGHTT